MHARITAIALALTFILSGCSATEKKAEEVDPSFSALA